MLSSLLPGLRDLRAPLAAGYVWLMALYIALEPLTPARDEASGVWASLIRLEDVVSTVGFGVAATFVAYLAGLISQAVSRWAGWLAHSSGALDWGLPRQTGRERIVQLARNDVGPHHASPAFLLEA